MTSLGVAYLIETLSKIKSLEKIGIWLGKPHLPSLTVLACTNIDEYALLPVLKLGDLPKLKKFRIRDCKPLVFLSLLHPFRSRAITNDPEVPQRRSPEEDGRPGVLGLYFGWSFCEILKILISKLPIFGSQK